MNILHRRQELGWLLRRRAVVAAPRVVPSTAQQLVADVLAQLLELHGRELHELVAGLIRAPPGAAVGPDDGAGGPAALAAQVPPEHAVRLRQHGLDQLLLAPLRVHADLRAAAGPRRDRRRRRWVAAVVGVPAGAAAGAAAGRVGPAR